MTTGVDKPVWNVGGKFVKGNPSKTGMRNTGGGRKVSRRTLLKRAKEGFEAGFPHAYDELMVTLLHQGLNGDTQAAQYVIDRLKGKPAASVDLRVKGHISLSADSLAEQERQAQLDAMAEATLIAEYSPVLLTEGLPIYKEGGNGGSADSLGSEVA